MNEVENKLEQCEECMKVAEGTGKYLDALGSGYTTRKQLKEILTQLTKTFDLEEAKDTLTHIVGALNCLRSDQDAPNMLEETYKGAEFLLRWLNLVSLPEVIDKMTAELEEAENWYGYEMKMTARALDDLLFCTGCDRGGPEY